MPHTTVFFALSCDTEEGDAMRILATLLVVSVFFLTFFAFSTPSASSDTSGCQDSTVVPTHLFGWDLTGDPYAIVVGTNGFVYIADAINDQICRYSLYGGGALCWGTPGIKLEMISMPGISARRPASA